MTRINQRLKGLNPLSYLGVNAYQPNDFIKIARDPLPSDCNNFYLGTWWLNTQTSSLYYLASLENNVANWVNISSMSGAVAALTANTGGQVSSTADNINVVGDGSTMSIAGNPGTSTLTITTAGSSGLGTITGNTGGAVGPTIGNINIVGTNPISVSGNPGTSTLTASHSSVVASSFSTQSGSAVPSAGALTIAGANGITTSGSGSTVTVTPAGSISQRFITSPATGTAVPVSGVITFAGGGGITVSASGSTVTITSSGGSIPTYSEGSWTPVVADGGNPPATYSRQYGYYVQIGNMVYIKVDIAFTTATSSSTFSSVSNPPFAPVVPVVGMSNTTAQFNITAPVQAGPIAATSLLYWWMQFTSGGSMIFNRSSATVGGVGSSTGFQNGSAFTLSGWYFI